MKKVINILTPLLVVTSTTIMNFTMVGCNKHEEEDDDMTQMTKEVLNEFMGNIITEEPVAGLTSVPRPSRYHEKIVPYLKNRISQITSLSDDDIHTDDAGNIYFDLPASSGCEDKDMIILQGHTDMVVAGMTEEEKEVNPINAELDLKNNIIHSKDYKTSLGADNGIGIAIMLYIAKHINDFNHGPIRFLMTADEEIGMVGAAAVDEK